MDKIERETYLKVERVSGKTRIETIFASGNAFLTYPFRVVYYKHDADTSSNTNALLISIPKKRLKRAVDRNRMKRLVREAYRLNRSYIDLSSLSNDSNVDIALIYVADKVLPYHIVEKSLIRLLREISKRLSMSHK